ncbi:hypothetical protein PFAG_02153 [Plasmodium falciparum Santa Lucia]|uniref:PH domain-containing protein n=7 Tax=Plasmodium falciparum TaxID=5833 RepID=A0A024VQP1_PLAFA|nr:hypothetical protein PFFVO_02197 [Plasmodium falciparum Vietnam Oak-Knoll (FVO)]ETW31059.1 hypothetical protein PFFCH_01498 [Plasmodium falciparum FCH/4]ETW43408.1 hypothetical protein PFNF135_02320 [Plasmodium falciparum NF135/5.C10]EUT87331.1 hypothetical protein PFAG_02153 [Plasmodium falciparum Santa Lucia]KNC37182.1 hypothetical protein PFLG_01973 [Plasmodium falciparum RAJ116]KOB63740.1 hypothetical protein PFHG_04163 [Plasmodium falciparum HB3]KOB88246.1 hypothetical protein PFDG_00
MRNIIFLLCLILSLACFCQGHKNYLKRDNYLQYLRSQTFLQERSKHKKFNRNYSEDINEFDEYEDEETDNLDNKISDEIKNKKKENYLSQNINEQKNNSINNNNEKKLTFKNIENEINSTDTFMDDSNVKSLGKTKECNVNEKGLLDVSLNSNDFFNMNKYNVEITSSNIIIKDKNNIKIIKEIPFEHIKLPITTIEETRECWYIKTTNDKILLCDKEKEERDIWITNILKALFCYNTNNLIIVNKEKKDTVSLPKESTVDKRINALKEKETIKSSDNNTSTNDNKVNNITISNFSDHEPKIVFN